ncbi:MAG TPA: zf-HC2 domain-containing protein [Smithella sp.]|nr:zf-HC2 domain-containing protein [Smithella sp.]HRS97699.1 zf-HC2 domain-containing protein [Smithella sp.]
MKTCKDIEKLLPLYPNDLRSRGEEEMFSQHLASCSSCAEKLAALEKAKALASGLDEMTPPRWLQQKIMAAVREEAAKKSVWEKLFYPLHIKIPVQIAATLVVAVLAVYVYQAGEDTMKKAAVPPAPVAEIQRERLHPQKPEASGQASVSKKDQAMRHHSSSLPEMKQPAVPEAAEVAGKQISSDIHSDQYKSRPAAKEIVSSSAEMKREEPFRSSDAVSKTQQAFDLSGRVQKPDILLAVADIEQSAADVEKILDRLGARNIVRRTTGGEVLCFAEIQNRKMKDLIAQLKFIGRVEAAESFSAETGGNISVAIGIVRD